MNDLAVTPVLKISVLSSGAVLLDGSAVPLSDLEDALKKAAAENADVWYYREGAQADPLPTATKVLGMIVQNRLKVSLSSKPDFSDYVDQQGRSRPRVGAAAGSTHAPCMPDVTEKPNLDETFGKVRQHAANERQLVIVTPKREYMLFSAPPPGSVQQAIVSGVEGMIPPATKRNIAVIGYTGFTGGSHGGPPDLTEANQAIPFFGLLIGFAYIGHAVWVFEGLSSALAEGCRDADVLIVDSGMLPFLTPGWQDVAPATMRNQNILVHDRATHQLRVVRKVGKSRDRIEFVD